MSWLGRTPRPFHSIVTAFPAIAARRRRAIPSVSPVTVISLRDPASAFAPDNSAQAPPSCRGVRPIADYGRKGPRGK